MAVGMSAATINALLDAIFNAEEYVIDSAWVQLHIGDPGANGTANGATETTRKLCPMGAASGGSISNNAEIEWVGIAGSEDATYFTLWDASTGGTFIGSGEISADAYTAGGSYVIAVGDLTVSITPAS